MKLILFSPSSGLPKEFELANNMLSDGVFMYHLHKPAFTLQEYENTLTKIKPAHKKYVVLHQHHVLAKRHQVGGLYFSRQHIEKITYAQKMEKLTTARKKGVKVCCGLHNLEEFKEKCTNFDYCLFSPVYKSISKSQHLPKISLETIKNAIIEHKIKNVCALGGITKNNIERIQPIGFFAVAVLGAIWQAEKPLEAYLEIKKQINNN